MNPVVKTRQGQLRGKFADGAYVFKGVPYAMPPFGENRLRPPRSVEPWDGVRDALDFGPEPPQPRVDPQLRALIPETVGPGEDCLNLNIWSPFIGSTNLPVMVWIHGGMFEFGSGAGYDGSRFARDGVVCVTINYRLGAEGFLFLPDSTANLGLLDQIAALQWVQDNIAAFGGDPANVTIFGESAGALSVGTLLAIPRAEGLFRRAIAQSGAAHGSLSAASARRVALDFAGRLGVDLCREAIAAAPYTCLISAQEELRAELVACPDRAKWGSEVAASFLPWQPVVDGDILPARPIDRITSGASANVDLLVGTNVEENRLFLGADGMDQVTPKALAAAVAVYDLPVASTLAAYRDRYPAASPGDLLAAIQTDWYWRIPAIRLCDVHSAAAGGAFMYEFAWRSPAFEGRLGACHALEIPFVFGTIDKGEDQLIGPLLGPAPPPQLANAMHSAWVGFAKTGDPGWPKYDLQRRTTMRFDATSAVVNDPRRWERELWADSR